MAVTISECYSQTKFLVDSPDEFVNAIGSDRIIQLKGSTIYISDISSAKEGLNYRLEEIWEGGSEYELTIFGVSNLKIEGLGDQPVKMITKPEYGSVLIFENCNNITIENIEAGHGPERGNCIGGVFKINNSKNFTINKSIMYGSGVEGISAEKVTGLKCNNSIIRECTYSIMTLNNSNDFEFNSCEFTDNEEFSLVRIFNCNKLIFNACNFTNNRTDIGNEDYYDYAILDVSQSTSIRLKDCVIKDNVANYFCKDKNSIELQNAKFENNLFTKGDFKE